MRDCLSRHQTTDMSTIQATVISQTDASTIQTTVISQTTGTSTIQCIHYFCMANKFEVKLKDI